MATFYGQVKGNGKTNATRQGSDASGITASVQSRKGSLTVERLDARRVAEELASLCDGSKSIALMCYERNPEECHRHVVSEWMTESGITVVEWEPAEVVQERLQMSMF